MEALETVKAADVDLPGDESACEGSILFSDDLEPVS